MKVEENVEMEGYQGKKVHIDLPAVGEFEGLKLEYFVSDEKMTSEDFEGNPKLKKKLYSMKDVGELLKTMNRYMKAMGVETDVDINYKNDLKYWRKEGKDGCEAGDCLKQITGLDFIYWLKDKNVDWKIKSRVGWYCRDKKCCFSRSKTIYDRTNLFLGLFD